MRLRRALCIASMSMVVFLLVAVSATAAPPLKLDAGLVTDDSGVLGADTESVKQALDALNIDQSVQLFVVYVDSFDGLDSQDWADQTAEINGLGLNDVLLAVAVVDRQYAWSVDQDFPLTDAQLADVATGDIEPALQDDEWAGAAIGAAEGYGRALAVARADAEPATSGGGGGATLLSCAIPAAFLVLIVAAVAFFLSKRKGKGTPASSATPVAGEPDMKSLETQAGQLLVEVDDALRASEEELGFAEAEFGSGAVDEYRSALATSKQEVAEAFRIQQRVYDAEPEDDATRRSMLIQIVELTQTADARLDEKAESFAALRDVAKRVDEVLAAVSTRVTAVEQGLPAAAATLAELKKTYSSSALGEVADDDTEAAGLVALAREAIAETGEANSKDDKSAAAISARKAEEAVAQAERLLQAVSSAKQALGQARTDLESEVVRLEQAAAAAEAQGSGEIAPLAKVARDAIAQAKSALAAASIDPVVELEKVRGAASQLDTATGAARDAAQAASNAIGTARERVASVESYVQTRRAAIGTQARSSLAEASRRLARAEELLASDPAAALAEAQAAQQEAESATRYAQGDVSTADRARTTSAPSSVAGAVVGGAIANALRGGGSSRGSSAGASRSSFGGSGRRSSGGSTSSSGRRGGGGRF